MHEFAIANSIKEIVYQNISSLENFEKIEVQSITLKHGLLSQLVPDILIDAFNSIVIDDKHLKNAQLNLEVIYPLLKCNACKEEFTSQSKEALFMPCPHCQNVGSFTLLQGKEMIVEHIEAKEI